MSSKPIRQGEVLLMPVGKMPKGVKYDSFIVGHSETGHHHVLESKTKFEVSETEKKELYLRLFEPAELVHKKSFDKHNTLTVNPGKYQVIYKKEYDPWEKVIRTVAD